MKLVILDSYALAPGDLDWTRLYGMVDEVEQYPRTKQEEIIPRLALADYAIVNKANINDAVLDACPRLKWIGVTATGTDSLDTEACRRRGVPVANVPGYSTHSVAQLALCLLLALCQSPVQYNAAVHSGHWQLDIPPAFGVMPMTELCGKTAGIVGYGAIGRQMAQVCGALGMRVLCHTRTVRAEFLHSGAAFVSLEELLRQSDVISLHCPATPQTAGLLRAETLALCKRGVRIVNTARGRLVDEPAMADALRTGQVAGFAADVLSAEPVRPENPLLHAPNVLLTPHIAWASPEALARLSACVVDNFAAFLAGESRNIVNA